MRQNNTNTGYKTINPSLTDYAKNMILEQGLPKDENGSAYLSGYIKFVYERNLNNNAIEVMVLLVDKKGNELMTLGKNISIRIKDAITVETPQPTKIVVTTI